MVFTFLCLFKHLFEHFLRFVYCTPFLCLFKHLSKHLLKHFQDVVFCTPRLPVLMFVRGVQADHQMSMTVAQQKVKVKHTGSHLKRIRGGYPIPAMCISLHLLSDCGVRKRILAVGC